MQIYKNNSFTFAIWCFNGVKEDRVTERMNMEAHTVRAPQHLLR